MLVELDQIPWPHNILASFFTWLLLAGFMVLPGTFASISNSKALEDAGRVGKTVLKAVQNVPLLFVAAICCFSAVAGLCYLGWTWRTNYIWLVNRIFL